jgi:ABC-type glycerol-3-phosphate transport system substrate-binding protein/DNA-binding transcriptional regulator YhcF (GntR family)
MTAIDRGSPIPIYHQLKTLILERIESGLWRPGDRIPTEAELCREYGISRSPVRQALNALAAEGVLVRRPGLGTFVDHDTSEPATSNAPIQAMVLEPSGWSVVFDRVARVWNSRQPQQPIDFGLRLVSHGQFNDSLTTAVGGGTAPDMLLVDCVWVNSLARSGFLYPLQELDSQWNRTKLVPRLSTAVLAANSYDGGLYAAPCAADVSVLWYRRDWFEREGLAPPIDWNDLVAVAEHFLQPTVRERYGLSYPLAFPGGSAAGETTVYALLPFVWSGGGEVCDDEAVVLNSPGTLRALQFLRELVCVHRVSPPDVARYTWDTVPRLFAAGKLAMALGGSYEAANIREESGWSGAAFAERVGCVVTPMAPGGVPVSTLGGTSYAIPRQCQRPRLVLELLRMALDLDVVGDLYRSLLVTSATPTLDATAALPPELPIDAIARGMGVVRARPSLPDYFKVSKQLQAMFESTLSGSAPLVEIVRRAAEFIAVISERPCRLA